MKKIIKYFVITILVTFCTIINVNAEVTKDSIDFDGTTVHYDDETDKFGINLSNFTAGYQWIKIADDGSSLINAYNEYEDARIAYQNASSEEITQKEEALETAKLNLYIQLNAGAIDENNWLDTDTYPGTINEGDKFIKWIKVTNNEDNKTTYGFGIYVVEQATITEENPDTAVNPLYFVPVLLILGSTLIFKKRRYE